MALKLIFMGTPEFAVPILESIYKSNHKILSVYTQSPKKKNRGQKINSTPVQQYSEKQGLNLRSPETFDEEEYEFLKSLNPDIVVVVAYGKILPPKFLNSTKIKFINIHASLLPKWRGAAPIQRSIMNLDKKTGISIMQIIPKLDSGPVLIKSEIEIKNDTNYETLSKKLSKLGASKILDALHLIEINKAQFINQNENEATYAKKIDKSEARINWKDSAKNIIGKINALNPNPGTWFKLNDSRIKIIKALEVRKKGKPGEILSQNFTIACADNAIQILELKKEGKKEMTAFEFVKGHNLVIGKILTNE